MICKHLIVLVHLGKHIIDYIEHCVIQARLFNTCSILLVLDSIETISHYQRQLESYDVQIVNIHSIPNSHLYNEFDKLSILDPNFFNGFFKHCSLRFFAIYEVVRHFGLENIFHIENDNLIYINLETIVQTCHQLYPHIAATFDNPFRGIPGFMYFKNQESIKLLCNTMLKYAKNGNNDVRMLRILQEECPTCIDNLPIAPKSYSSPLDAEYYKNIDHFRCVFDAAHYGQFIGGMDPRVNCKKKSGYINKHAVVSCSNIHVHWEIVDGLKFPYANETPIANLHIHCKELSKYMSL